MQAGIFRNPPDRSRRPIGLMPASRPGLNPSSVPNGAFDASAHSTARRSFEKTHARRRSHNRNQNSDSCGGARAPSDVVGAASSPRSRRCASIRAMSSGSSMLAITFKCPPQRAHCSISIPNTPYCATPFLASAARAGTVCSENTFWPARGPTATRYVLRERPTAHIHGHAGAACRIHRGVRDRDADQVNQRECQADGDRREAGRRTLVRGAEDDREEHRRHHDFARERRLHRILSRRMLAKPFDANPALTSKPVGRS